VRLGVKRFDDPAILNSIDVVDRELGVDLPGGRLWHRFSFDGYGETRSGDPWFIEDQEKPQSEQPGTLGRAWPIFAGERGEYGCSRGARPRRSSRRSRPPRGRAVLPEQVAVNGEPRSIRTPASPDSQAERTAATWAGSERNPKSRRKARS
jgi:glucoamylase